MTVFRRFAPLAAVAVALIAAHPGRAGEVYLSLGDSIAFGYDVSTPASMAPSYGDQGFARFFADHVNDESGGARPAVLNLAVVGEQSASFINPAALVETGPARQWDLNLNYADGATSQLAQMMGRIANIHAAGDTIGAVSLIFGGNDIFALAGSAAFQAATLAEKQAMVGQTIYSILGNYVAVLTTLQSMAPEARILLPGYFNPYPWQPTPWPSLPTRGVEGDFYDQVLATFNPAVAYLASQFSGATYVDIYRVFDNNELVLTNILLNDVHPNQNGYADIAAALLDASPPAAVPEPSAVVSLTLGFAGLATLAWRRRRAA